MAGALLFAVFGFGLLVGRGMDLNEAAAKIQDMAATWPKSEETV